jgi:transposase
MTKGEQEAREELKAARKKIREQEKEINRKDKALAEMAAIVTLQKITELLFQDPKED